MGKMQSPLLTFTPGSTVLPSAEADDEATDQQTEGQEFQGNPFLAFTASSIPFPFSDNTCCILFSSSSAHGSGRLAPNLFLIKELISVVTLGMLQILQNVTLSKYLYFGLLS